MAGFGIHDFVETIKISEVCDVALDASGVPANFADGGVKLLPAPAIDRRNRMVGDYADAMLEVMAEGTHEARHEVKYRRIELITGRRQRRNWMDEKKARIVAESAEPDVNISAVARRWGVNRGLLNVWRREAGLTSQRSAKAFAQQPMFVPVTVSDRTSPESSSSDATNFVVGRIEIEIAGTRMTIVGSVAPERSSISRPTTCQSGQGRSFERKRHCDSVTAHEMPSSIWSMPSR